MQQLASQSRFEAALHPERFETVMLWDRRIAASEYFIAVPSRGSLLPGWSLILPRRRMFSMASLNGKERRDLCEFHLRVAAGIESAFGPVTTFEHGAGKSGTEMGCGVDHAHLHLVSLPFDLIEIVCADKKAGIRWRSVDQSVLGVGVDSPSINYMTISSPSGECVVASGFKPVSQYLRKIIAKNLGIGGMWNYREHAFEKNVHATLERLTVGEQAVLSPR